MAISKIGTNGLDQSGNLELGASGNVGIGTSSPTQKLQVAGNGYFLQPNGTASFVQIAQTGVESWQILNPASSTALTFANSGTERMRIDGSGNVGVGISSPAGKFNIYKTKATSSLENMLETTTEDTSGGISSTFRVECTPSSTPIVNLVARAGGNQTTSAMGFVTRISGTEAERMRIDSSGRVIVGSSSSLGAAVVGIYSADLANTNTGIYIRNGTNNTGGWFIGFQNYLGNDSGHINQNGTATVAYTTSSDYRLKENVQPMVGALDKVSRLKPVTYIWKDTDGEVGEGFIAHELAEVCPLAVSGEKDAVKEDGSIKPQGIDTSFLVATLTAAIQELSAKVTELEAKVK